LESLLGYHFRSLPQLVVIQELFLYFCYFSCR